MKTKTYSFNTILTLFIIWFSTFSYAQNTQAPLQIAKGIVVKEVLNTPLEGVLVEAIHSNTHTHTLSDGHFSLPITDPSDTLYVYLKGYQKAKIPIKKKSSYNIRLISQYSILDEVVIKGRERNFGAQLTHIDLALTPVNTSQDLLRKVPGLFIAQHQGGGKAEQIFLRGFDNDHGTDIRISADGMPVNMVSHAHGQGYSDLHFLIPETIDNISFGKGSYYVDKGDFTTSGYVDFNTYKKLPYSLVKLEGGNFNTARAMAMIDILPQMTDKNAYIAAEYNYTDGPFKIPQNFSRLNIIAKYNQQITPKTYLNIQASAFSSAWNGSGQIPVRAVQEGIIARFGSLDSTEGGKTSRTNLIAHLKNKISNTETLESTFYYANYAFDLWSDFTYFLVHPEKGDAIHQQDRRNLWGMDHEYVKTFTFSKSTLKWRSGIGFRYDDINKLFLGYVINRETPNGAMADGRVYNIPDTGL